MLCTTAVIPFPQLNEQLIAALAAQFPERSAELDWSEKEVWFKGGQASVVRFLAAKLEEQQEGAFTLEAD